METRTREGHSDGVTDDVFESMSLVDDDHVVFGQYGAVRSDVEPVQMRVHDDDVGLGRPETGGLGETHSSEWAASRPGAFVGTYCHGSFGVAADAERKISEIAGVVAIGPLLHLCDLTMLASTRSFELHLLLALPTHDLLETLTTDVIAASLEYRPLEVASHRGGDGLGDEGEILVGQLILEGFGRRGDHGLATRGDKGDQIAEGLSCTCPGLYDEVPTGLDSRIDGFGHGALARSILGRPERARGDVEEVANRKWSCGHASTVPSGRTCERDGGVEFVRVEVGPRPIGVVRRCAVGLPEKEVRHTMFTRSAHHHIDRGHVGLIHAGSQSIDGDRTRRSQGPSAGLDDFGSTAVVECDCQCHLLVVPRVGDRLFDRSLNEHWRTRRGVVEGAADPLDSHPEFVQFGHPTEEATVESEDVANLPARTYPVLGRETEHREPVDVATYGGSDDLGQILLASRVASRPR